MLKRKDIIAAAKRVAQRLAANEAGVAPPKEKHARRLAALKQNRQATRKSQKAAARP